MLRNSKQRLAHICILVRDIDQAIKHYTNILAAVSPHYLRERVSKEEHLAGKDRYVTAFFRSGGEGCDLQLLQPLNQDSPLYQRLQKVGEGVHHFAFTTSNLEGTFQELKEKRISLHGDEFICSAENPRIRWMWILPSSAHGALIEVMDDYSAERPSSPTAPEE